MSEDSDAEDRVASEHRDNLRSDYSSEHDSEHDSDHYSEHGSEHSFEDDASEGVEYGSAHGFLDMEAAESEGEGEYEEEYAADDAEEFFFPQFNRLPPELRARIWDFFDPNLRVKARIYPLATVPNEMERTMEFWETPDLVDTTAPARVMLATYSESRALALNRYPSTLEIRGHRGTLRYHCERDIVLIERYTWWRSPKMEWLHVLLRDIRHLAVRRLEGPNRAMMILRLTPPLHRLKVLYACVDESTMSSRTLQWCVSDSIHTYHTKHTEENGIRPLILETMYCWPDLENHRKFATEAIDPLIHETAETFELWPMVQFEFDSGMSQFHQLRAMAKPVEWNEGLVYPDGSSGSEAESDIESGTEDQYESEGIDDATIDGDSGSSDDDDDLAVQSDSEEDNMSTFDGFSPIQAGDPELHLAGDVEAGNFSSLEPESSRHDNDESEHAASDEEPTRPSNRRRRQIVMSDDESNSEDDSDEPVNLPSRPAKRARAVISDTEDEDNEDGVRAAKKGKAVASESDNDEDSEEEEYEDDEKPLEARPMSLFEKLKRFRDDNPVSPDAVSDSDTEASMDNEGYYDRGDDLHFQDDEVDDEDELPENEGMVTDVSEGGGDDDDDDEW